MKSEEIKCCPFCGNKSPRVRLRNTFQSMSVVCDNCDTFGPLAWSTSDATSKWNNLVNREDTNG